MRYILPFSALILSCTSVLIREVGMGNIVVILSKDGDGICAIRSDTSDNVKISVISRGKSGEIFFYSKVLMGEEIGLGWKVKDTVPINVFRVKFESSEAVDLRILDKRIIVNFPECAQISEPKQTSFLDWGKVRFSWVCDAKKYIIRFYAFTMMDQRDIIKFVEGNEISFDLSGMYGDGFFALQVCPVNSYKSGLSVYAIGGCTEKVILVGDTSVWEGENPTLPHNKEIFMWYLLQF